MILLVASLYKTIFYSDKFDKKKTNPKITGRKKHRKNKTTKSLGKYVRACDETYPPYNINYK